MKVFLSDNPLRVIGNLISVFFITQFFTSLLWSSIADRHGRRAVIVASMAGSAIALIIFGTSESVSQVYSRMES